MATLRVHHSTEYWKKTDLMVKPASYPIAVGYDVPSVDTIHRPLTLDLSEVCHEDRVYWAVRRAQDILLSSLALVVLSPLLLVTYAAIWIDSPGASPIFTQQRVGRNGKLFKMYKFRTMCPDAEQKLKDLMERNEKDGPVFKMKNDPRITRVGKFLRKTSIEMCIRDSDRGGRCHRECREQGAGQGPAHRRQHERGLHLPGLHRHGRRHSGRDLKKTNPLSHLR